MNQELRDMKDIEQIIWIERRFGITKTINGDLSTDAISNAEKELVSILLKYKGQLSIASPLPKIRIWPANGKLNFIFFDKRSGRRILLGDWLSNRGTAYER